MLYYVLRRALAVLPILFGVTVICFSLVHLAPGDAISAVTPDNATPELIAAIRKAYGYDQPLPVQYLRWLGLVLHGNLGTSIMTGRPVIAEIVPAALHTAILAVAAICISVCTGFCMGMLAGYTPRIWADRALTALAILGVSVPHYWVGIVLVAIFSVELGLLPAMGMGPATSLHTVSLNDLRFIILPALTLSLIPTAIIARTVRATVIETRKNEFIQTLRSVGLSRARIARHVVKNSAPTILTVIGLQIAQLLGGSILVETVFAWPGTGYLLNTAISTRDLPLLQGTILILATFFVLMNFVVDMVQPLFDPRIARHAS
jgi:peptide/nickel transport system permease protein